MSFKDKPLKKIVADKRVTIDAIHQEISRDFIREKEKYHTNLKKKETLQQDLINNPSDEIKKELELLDLVSLFNLNLITLKISLFSN